MRGGVMDGQITTVLPRDAL